MIGVRPAKRAESIFAEFSFQKSLGLTSKLGDALIHEGPVVIVVRVLVWKKIGLRFALRGRKA